MPLFCACFQHSLKKIIAISLFFLLLASQFGHHLLFSIQDMAIRQEQERRILSHIPEAFLERIEDTPGLTWEDPGKEFLHAGKMYDLVRSRTEGGKTIHYAILDDKEGELVSAFSKVLNTDPNAPQAPKGGKMNFKLQIPVFTLPMAPLATAQEMAKKCLVPAASGRIIDRPRTVLPSPPWA